MSHKIKIDLCEVFGVKEGQEFRILPSSSKYKIENNILMCCFEDVGWDKSVRSLGEFLNPTKEFEIEILKPETPPEIKKMLQAFCDLGFKRFWASDNHYPFYEINDDALGMILVGAYDFINWADSLGEFMTTHIKDYI